MDSMLLETLNGPGVQLRPLLPSDGPTLIEAADGGLWNLPFTVIPSVRTVEGYIRVALEGWERSAMPFVTRIFEARLTGIIRHERIMPDGRKRNSVRFSIIDEEWPGVRQTQEPRRANQGE